MRDRLIHDYFGVDYELLWDVAQHRVPEVRRQLESILKAYNKRLRLSAAAVGSGQGQARQ